MKPKAISIFLLLFIIWALATILLSGCMTTEKATQYLNNHKEDAAKYCADAFPVKVDSVVIVKLDTVVQKQTQIDLNKFADSIINNAYRKKDKEIKDLNGALDAMQNQQQITKAAADYLRGQVLKIRPVDTSGLAAASRKKIDEAVKACQNTFTKVTEENTARVTQLQLKADRLQEEKDSMTAKRDWWRKACLITWAIIAVYIVLRYFAGKVSIISRFIK